jgi:hypothetical protein
MVMVTTNPFKSVVITEANGKDLRIDEGMQIKFANLDGEEVSGFLAKISGKGEKVKFLIDPPDSQRQELWKLADMSEGSLSICEEE